MESHLRTPHHLAEAQSAMVIKTQIIRNWRWAFPLQTLNPKPYTGRIKSVVAVPIEWGQRPLWRERVRILNKRNPATRIACSSLPGRIWEQSIARSPRSRAKQSFHDPGLPVPPRRFVLGRFYINVQKHGNLIASLQLQDGSRISESV